jgi:hypothetical protein
MIYDSFNYIVDSCENGGGQVHILGIFYGLILRLVENICLAKFIHLLHSVSDCVNVIDIAELDITVRIVLRVLNTSSLNSVGVCSYLRTCIKYNQLVAWVVYVCATYFRKDKLVIWISITH